MRKALLLMAVLLIGFTACTTGYQKEAVTTTKYFSFGNGEKSSNLHVMELRLLRAEREIPSGDFDRNDFDDLDRRLERFFPETLVVPKGDRVAIAFNTEKSNYISINGEGYSAKAGTYFFNAEEEGSYLIECLDCADNPTAVIRVV